MMPSFKNCRMRSYALTYPQLMNQAARCAFGSEDLSRLRQSHDLAQRLVDGWYRRQGVPFLCHLVRTASIVMSEVGSMDVIVAALLHPAYSEMLGETGRRAFKGGNLRRRVGDVADEILQGYSTFAWFGDGVVHGYIAHAGQHSVLVRHLLLIRLANELEDHLDAAVEYAPKGRHYVHSGAAYIELAQRLGFADLAADLREAFQECRRAQVSPALMAHQVDAYKLE